MYYKINTYGCQMNIHESEKVAGVLEKLGFSPVAEEENADIIVYNTCCIRETAEKRALGNIGSIKHLKKKKNNLIIVVLGCLTEQPGYIEIFKQEYPHVDIVLGTRNISDLETALKDCINSKRKFHSTGQTEDFLVKDEKLPVSRDSYPNAWVNIMYGCNNFCTYCIVPYVRGREISRPMDAILDEVKRCVAEDFKEITLLGQNVNSYGQDLNDGSNFEKLLREVAKIDGKFRVRFLTSHPKDLTDGIIDAIASSEKLCKFIHLPVQAGSSKVLKDMNRKYDKERYLELVKKIKDRIPGVKITTDIMVGFPTETEEDFEETLDVVRKCRFSNAFTFIYSPRKGTPAAKMQQLPYDLKKKRIMELIKLQNSITKGISKEYEGGIYEILVEDVSPKYEGNVCGRTDCGRLVTFPGTKDMIGSFVRVKITKSKSASLFGEIVD
ncbi:MAG: tRNA (N6-isopentenyl adenosine(37)-C2)-methylthiotransferase MiaB [Clostridiales bacterium]|nr:tRNA (N6-isopentenyl adenosine(37)-C2)-methylthiotransferase MiaB [Clostridiales bacterium]